MANERLNRQEFFDAMDGKTLDPFALNQETTASKNELEWLMQYQLGRIAGKYKTNQPLTSVEQQIMRRHGAVINTASTHSVNGKMR